MTIFNSYVSSPEGTLYFADLLVMCVALVGDFPPAVAAGSQPTPGWVRGIWFGRLSNVRPPATIAQLVQIPSGYVKIAIENDH